MKRLLLVDGHSMAYRAFFALPVENFSNSKGQATNAIYGFGSMLLNLIAAEKPTHIAVAFDVSRKTFRSELFPEYKATRSATPDEFRSQMSYLEELITALGIEYLSMPGFEADDIIATLATQAEAEGFEVLISTGDRDSFQLVTDGVTVLYPKKGVGELARMTPAAVEEKYGLTPKQYPDFAALRGDPSDNLPSIPGVGEKTATKWIVEYGSLSNLLAHAMEITGKVGDSLRAHVAGVELNRELTELKRDLELPKTLSDLEWLGVDRFAAEKLLTSLEIKALKSKVQALPSQGAVTDELEEGIEAKTISQVSATVTKSSLSEIESLLSKHTGEIVLYFEFSVDEAPWALALSATEVYECEEKTSSTVLNSKHPKIIYEAKKFLREIDISNLAFDPELAAYLLNPGDRNLGLADLAERYLGKPLESGGDDLFSNFVPSNAGVILELKEVLEGELRSKELMDLFVDLEMPTLRTLALMERRGIGVDKKSLTALRNEFTSQTGEQTALAHASAGHEFNVASPKQLQVVLFDELGLPKTKKIKTGYTTDAESLQDLFEKSQHPLLMHLLRIREMSKLGSIVEGLINSVAADGRIHTNFQQTVAATGRLSSTDPNLQNIPVRTEDGRKIRDCFVAQKPFVSLLTADYSQIEMRIMAHLSGDEGLIQAFKSGEDLHSTVASHVFGVKPSEVDAEMRRQIKAMSYGLAYGLSAYGLSQQLGITPGAAQTLMNQYFERFGGIQDYLHGVVDLARKNGYTETILGRRRYLPDLTSEVRARREVAERMALNAPIQGSAADIIKVAMLKVAQGIDEAELKSRLLLQVHDELIFEVADGEEQQLESIVRAGMEGAFTLRVPLTVNVGVGESWDSAAH